MSLDRKTSLLIPSQVPEFIREEYPLFISFLEAYYEFLENKQGTQKNDLIKKSKDIRYLSDVDYSIDEFQSNFLNTFASLVPKDALVSKEILIKNILPLYLSKGSEKSFKLLFRFLFGEELKLSYPRNDILRASDGKWQIDKSLKVSTSPESYYTGDGQTKIFKILDSFDAEELVIKVDNTEVNSGYVVYSEYKKLIFDIAPANNSIISVIYPDTINEKLFVNRRVVGEKSGASAIVESAISRFYRQLKLDEFFINEKTKIGNFIQGENILTNIFVDEELVDVRFRSISAIEKITILDGGSKYNIGDPVLISFDSFEKPATAIVSKVYTGSVNSVSVIDGGAGFQIGCNLKIEGYTTDTIDINVLSVDDIETRITPNTFVVIRDIISDIDPSNTLISATNYGLTGEATTNVNSIIFRSFTNTVFQAVGTINQTEILKSDATFISPPVIDVEPAKTVVSKIGSTSTNTTLFIDSYGALGKLKIVNGGVNYVVGDELVFTNKPMSFGFGATAIVSSVDANGVINGVDFVPPKLSGTVTATNTSVVVTGTGTSFTTQLEVGNKVFVNNETRTVATITSDTSLNVTSVFSRSFSSKPIYGFDFDLIGGRGYTPDKLPTVTVSSATGSNAVITVPCIMGDGEILNFGLGDKRFGEIQEIFVIDPGLNFQSLPVVDLTQYGDGKALAKVDLTPTFEVFPGRWITSDSILSSIDRKLQGKNYYVNFSYLLNSSIEFEKYKKVYKELLNPAGFKVYTECEKSNNLIILDNSLVDSSNSTTISGRVNTNSTIYVTGVNTKFLVANTRGILVPNSNVSINGETRTVNTIISNTIFTVKTSFSKTSNNQDLIILTN